MIQEERVGSYLSNLHLRIRGPKDRDKIEWAIRSVMGEPAIAAGSSLRTAKNLPAVLVPGPIRTISIAPADRGVKWLAVYDDEADLPGHQLTKMAQALSLFLETPIVAISLSGSILYGGLVHDGEIWDSISRPLDELEEDGDERYVGDAEQWAERLGVDGDRLRAAWDGEFVLGEERLLAFSKALAMNDARSLMGAKYLLEKPLDAGFTVMRFRWTAPGWAIEP